MNSLPRDPKSEPADDLLDLYRLGDRTAFDQLVEAYHPRLVQFFYRLCWDLPRSEDLAQTLFLKLLRHSHRYRSEGKLGTYIFRVATNLWIDHYRTNRPGRRLYSLDRAIDDGYEPSEAPGYQAPLDAASDAEDRWRLRGALDKLTEPHRLVFELAVYQELPYAEISDVLGIPVGTVKSRMHNSVRALKSILTESQEGRSASATFPRLGGQVG